jgi:hypothetical protein
MLYNMIWEAMRGVQNCLLEIVCEKIRNASLIVTEIEILLHKYVFKPNFCITGVCNKVSILCTSS